MKNMNNEAVASPLPVVRNHAYTFDWRVFENMNDLEFLKQIVHIRSIRSLRRAFLAAIKTNDARVIRERYESLISNR